MPATVYLQLESLKKGESIHKDDDGATLLANTYDPDVDPKNTKSNKIRQQQQEIISKQKLQFSKFRHFHFDCYYYFAISISTVIINDIYN